MLKEVRTRTVCADCRWFDENVRGEWGIPIKSATHAECKHPNGRDLVTGIARLCSERRVETGPYCDDFSAR